MNDTHNRHKPYRKPEATKPRGSVEKFIGKCTVWAAIGVAAGAAIVHGKAEAVQPAITERPHREYVIKNSTERLWDIAQRAHPGQDPRKSVYEITQDQPEGFDVGEMHVGDTVYLEEDSEIGKLADPSAPRS